MDLASVRPSSGAVADPQLQQLVDAWSRLPDDVRRMIVGVVAAVRRPG